MAATDQLGKLSMSPSKVKRKNHERSAKKPSREYALRNEGYVSACQTEMPVRKTQTTDGIQSMAASFPREYVSPTYENIQTVSKTDRSTENDAKPVT